MSSFILLDANSTDLKGDFEELRNEVTAFDDGLAQKAAIIAVNKSDAMDDVGMGNYVKEVLADTGLPVIMISALEKRALDELISSVHRLALEAKDRPSNEPAPEVVFRPKPVDRRDRQ